MRELRLSLPNHKQNNQYNKMTTIQIINKEYPTIKEIFPNVTEKSISKFIKKNQNGGYIIKILNEKKIN